MNTNNRNVRLQQNVVLLTAMKYAEDLIKKFIYIYIFIINYHACSSFIQFELQVI